MVQKDRCEAPILSEAVAITLQNRKYPDPTLYPDNPDGTKDGQNNMMVKDF